MKRSGAAGRDIYRAARPHESTDSFAESTISIGENADCLCERNSQAVSLSMSRNLNKFLNRQTLHLLLAPLAPCLMCLWCVSWVCVVSLMRLQETESVLIVYE